MKARCAEPPVFARAAAREPRPGRGLQAARARRGPSRATMAKTALVASSPFALGFTLGVAAAWAAALVYLKKFRAAPVNPAWARQASVRLRSSSGLLPQTKAPAPAESAASNGRAGFGQASADGRAELAL